MAVSKVRPAFLVRVEQKYGTRKISAHPVARQDDGDLVNITHNRFGDGAADFRHLTDLRVEAYLGHASGLSALTGEKDGDVWGHGTYFYPHMVEYADHARVIASTLGKVEKGLQRLDDAAGYLKSDDFAGYLLRVATVLRVPDIYVRNLARTREISGEVNRKVNGASLQSWLSAVSEKANEGDWSALGLR